MTTPDSSAVRAWAKENGYDVAGRGRLPGEVTDAYLAATGGRPAKKAAGKKPVKKATPAKRTPAKKTPAKKAAATVVEAPAAAPAQAAEDTRSPQPKPSPVADDRRLVALGEEIAALTKRVEALEKAAGTGGKAGSKTRFRRR